MNKEEEEEMRRPNQRVVDIDQTSSGHDGTSVTVSS